MWGKEKEAALQGLELACSPDSALLLTTQHNLQEAEPKLPNLLKLLVWAQKQLDEKAAYPRIDHLVTAELVDPPPADD
jgi:hypothetical protein